MAILATMLMRYDIAPESWSWDMPEKELMGFAAIVPPQRDITVESWPRGRTGTSIGSTNWGTRAQGHRYYVDDQEVSARFLEGAPKVSLNCSRELLHEVHDCSIRLHHIWNPQ